MTAMPTGRVIVNAAAAVEGALLASFSASSQILLGKHYYALSIAQYAVLFVPQLVTAVSAALIAARKAQQASRGWVFRAGLALSLAGMLLLMVTLLADGGVSADYPLLLVANALVGAGFGLVYPALTAFATDLNPMRHQHCVLMLNLALAGGMAVSAGLEFAATEAGYWWAVPTLLAVLAGLMIALGSRSILGPDAARTCALAKPGERAPAHLRIYMVLALLAGICAVMCVTWSQINMAKPFTHPGFRALLLGAFWAALVMFARVAFAAIERRRTWQRTASVALFLPSAAVALTGLAVQDGETAVIGIFLLAAVACAAFLPLTTQSGHDHLTALSLVMTAGIVIVYPAGLAVAGPSLNAFKSGGATALVIFAIAGGIAVVACLISAGLLIAHGPGFDELGPTLAWISPQAAAGPPDPRLASGTTERKPPDETRSYTSAERWRCR